MACGGCARRRAAIKEGAKKVVKRVRRNRGK